MAKQIDTVVSKSVPGLDVDGVVFAQDGRNRSAPDDYYLGAYTLRECTDESGPSWRLMGCGLDFHCDNPESIVVQLRQLGANLASTFGEP